MIITKMIKASDINNLLEKWMTTSTGYKFEVLENPLTWKEAAKALKDDLRDVVVIQKANPVLRWGYDPRTEEVKAWVGYLAIHSKVYGSEYDWDKNNMIFGYIDTRRKISDALGWGKYFGDFKNMKDLPERLQIFLRGTTLDFVDDTLLF
jgi:hypothetical protein